MTEKRFTMDYEPTYQEVMYLDNNDVMTDKEVLNTLNKFADENEELKFENENLKVAIQARDALIEVCEKKFRELGYIITVDDDGYVIE